MASGRSVRGLISVAKRRGDRLQSTLNAAREKLREIANDLSLADEDLANARVDAARVTAEREEQLALPGVKASNFTTLEILQVAAARRIRECESAQLQRVRAAEAQNEVVNNAFRALRANEGRLDRFKDLLAREALAMSIRQSDAEDEDIAEALSVTRRGLRE